MSQFDHFVGTRPVSDQHRIDAQALTVATFELARPSLAV